jgi:hypothetical protein
VLSEVENASEIVLSARQLRAQAKLKRKADAKARKHAKKGKKK